MLNKKAALKFLVTGLNGADLSTLLGDLIRGQAGGLPADSQWLSAATPPAISGGIFIPGFLVTAGS